MGEIEGDFYDQNVLDYFYLREKPENRFINDSLETTFKTFDLVLDEFSNQFAKYTSLTYVTGRKLQVSHYKYAKLHHEFLERGAEVIDDYINNVVKTMSSVRYSHAELVKKIKYIYPDFEFHHL